jgi:hypothetical protein
MDEPADSDLDSLSFLYRFSLRRQNSEAVMASTIKYIEELELQLYPTKFEQPQPAMRRHCDAAVAECPRKRPCGIGAGRPRRQASAARRRVIASDQQISSLDFFRDIVSAFSNLPRLHKSAVTGSV